MKLFDLSPGQQQAKEKLRKKFPTLTDVELQVRVFTPIQRFWWRALHFAALAFGVLLFIALWLAAQGKLFR